MITTIISVYWDFIEKVQQWFTAEAYQRKYGISARFPSILSIVLRFLLKCFYIVFPIVWIFAFVMGRGEDIPFVGALIVSPVAAILYCIFIFVIFLVFVWL